MSTVSPRHETLREVVENKFAIFRSSNTFLPFNYEKKIFDVAVTTALLRSSESWITTNVKPIVKQYNKLITCLLGVRRNTCVNLCVSKAGTLPGTML